MLDHGLPSARAERRWWWIFASLGMLTFFVGSGLHAQPGPAVSQPMDETREEAIFDKGQTIYVWAYTLVNMHNRRAAYVYAETVANLSRQRFGSSLSDLFRSDTSSRGFTSPLNRLKMQTDYIAPEQRFIVCPNQDVAYGIGFCDLAKSPVVFQVPDFADRYWSIELLDQRSDVFGSPGMRLGSAPGHYLIVGPEWEGTVPEGIEDVYRSTTRYAVILPRVFLDDSAEDREAIQPLLNNIMAYPIDEFTGEMKSTDWRAASDLPPPGGKDEFRWVRPENFWDQLPAVLDEVPPLEGEEGLYDEARRLSEFYRQVPELNSILQRAAAEADESVLQPMFDFCNVGHDFGGGWTGVLNGARFGRDYLSRTAVSKAYMLVHLAEEALYLATDVDAAGQQLDGNDSYRIHFPAGQLPPVAGFWSLTVYDQFHFFAENELHRYSLGTKNESLSYGSDGSLTLFLQRESPGPPYESNWLPVPAEPFGVMLRCYLPDASVLAGAWQPPPLVREDRARHPASDVPFAGYDLARYTVTKREMSGENRASYEDGSRRSRRRRVRAARASSSDREARRPRRARR